MKGQKSCQHPEGVRIADPFDEERFLCGHCGAAVAASSLQERTLRELLREQRRWRWSQEA
jgi:hypothetical protein